MEDKLIRRNQITRIPESLSDYLGTLQVETREAFEELFQSAIQEIKRFAVPDLWDESEIAVTYWVLMLSGINQDEEKHIASELVFWKTFLAKHSARVVCVQSSDRREFKCCSSSFDIVNCPTLVFSNDPYMEDYVKIDPQLLFKLGEQKGGLQRFFTRLNSLSENGKSIGEIKLLLNTEKFWSGLKLVYGEVKGLVSFSKSL